MVSEDVKNTMLATLVPGAGFVVGMAAFANDEALVKWFQDLKRPDFAPKAIWPYVLGDIASMAPLGCASYLVYKHGGGFEYSDTKAALATYGLTLGVGSTGIFFMKKKNLKGLFASSAATTGGAALTAFLFHKIYANAGTMMIPFCVWSGVSTFLCYRMWQDNKTIRDL